MWIIGDVRMVQEWFGLLTSSSEAYVMFSVSLGTGGLWNGLCSAYAGNS